MLMLIRPCYSLALDLKAFFKENENNVMGEPSGKARLD